MAPLVLFSAAEFLLAVSRQHFGMESGEGL